MHAPAPAPERAPERAPALHAQHAPQGVLHVVGRLTDAVFHLLGPITAALAAETRYQALLVIDDPSARRLAQQMDPRIVVHFTPIGPNRLTRWIMLARRFQALVGERAWEAVHLHGLMPVVVGTPLAKRLERVGTRIFVTPHNSRLLNSARWLGRPTLGLLKQFVPLHTYRTIANVSTDVRALDRMAKMPVRLIESPVAEIFFSVAKLVDPPQPVIVGGAAYDAFDSVQRFAQIAVLLNHASADLQCRWTTPVEPARQALLEAAGVQLMPGLGDPYARARALAEATVFVAPSAGQGFPMALAEAMAVGLPCVAATDEIHRDMVTHERTGVLADTPAALAQRVMTLLESQALRRELGTAARHEAMERFSGVAFRERVVSVFSPPHRLGTADTGRSP